MAMTMEQHRQLGAVGFDQFTDPWASAHTASSVSQLYPTSLGPNHMRFDALAKQQATRPSNGSMPYNNNMPANSASVGTSNGYPSVPYMNLSQDMVNPSRSTYNQTYSTAPSPSINTFNSASAMFLGPFGNLSQQSQHDMNRRLSQQSSSSAQSQATYDTMDTGRGIVAMNQDLTTPRNVYGLKPDRASADSYGFPSSHSPHSSISSASTFPTYYNSSVDGSSVSDYGSQSDSMETMNSRTLPRPSGLMNSLQPPAPQSMMGQFNSKVSSSAQKKHKCKVCDKRFTRPSSLQTHMYSHTGEKPYACEAKGCGRHFSVVSNLRRHRKVHKGDHASDRESPEGSWETEK